MTLCNEALRMTSPLGVRTNSPRSWGAPLPDVCAGWFSLHTMGFAVCMRIQHQDPRSFRVFQESIFGLDDALHYTSSQLKTIEIDMCLQVLHTLITFPKHQCHDAVSPSFSGNWVAHIT